MLKFRNLLWMMLLCVALPCVAQQEGVTVTARFDTSHILVGDHLRLQLSAQTTGTADLSFQSKEEWRMMNCEVLDVSILFFIGKLTINQGSIPLDATTF